MDILSEVWNELAANVSRFSKSNGTEISGWLFSLSAFLQFWHSIQNLILSTKKPDNQRFKKAFTATVFFPMNFCQLCL
jgi:elongation factor P hydroxylase